MFGVHPDLRVLTHSFPTRRSSDLCVMERRPVYVISTDSSRAAAGEQLAALCRVMSAPFVETADARELAYVINARSEEHTSELQSLMRISYAVFCLKKKI